MRWTTTSFSEPGDYIPQPEISIDDNTAANRRKPDPNVGVGFGERSVDDMLQVWVNIVYLDEAEFQRLVEERKAKPAQTFSGQNR